MRPSALCLCVLLPALAFGGSPDPLERMSRGEFDGALKLLDVQLKQTSDAIKLAQLHLLRAQCFSAVGQPARARGAVEQALKQNPEARLPESLESPMMTELIEQVRGSLKGELAVASAVTDAEVRIDGKSAGPPPLRIPVPIGRRTVELRAPGFEPLRKEIVVGTAGAAEVSFAAAELEPVERVQPAATLSPEPALSSAPALAQPPSPPPPALASPAPAPTSPSRLVPALLLVGGAVLVSGGAVGTAIAVDAKVRFDAQQREPALLEGGVTRAEAETVQAIFVVSLAAGAAGLALAGVGLFQFLAPPEQSAVAVVPLPGGAAVSVSGRF